MATVCTLAIGTFLVVAPVASGEVLAAGDDSHAGTVDEIIEHLRADPILVQPSMAMGDSARAHDVLTDAAAGVDVPVYVVLAEVPADLTDAERPAEQAAALFRDALGDGLYYVDFPDGPSYSHGWGDGLEDFTGRAANDAVLSAEANASGEYPMASSLLEAVYTVRSAEQPGAALPESVVEEYANQSWAIRPETGSARTDATAGRWVAVIATTSGIVVAGLIVTLVVARTAPLPRRDDHAPIPADARVHAQRIVDAARRRLAELPAATLTDPQAESATRAIEAADRAMSTGDDLDAVGAQVLGRVAHRELNRRTDPDSKPYRPCFVNPAHGEAHDTVRVGGSSIDAPVCRSCAQQRDPGPFLSVRSGRRGWKPYVETSTVWARTGFGALVGDLADQVLDDRVTRP